jgi:hypothetical protein
MYLLGEEYEPSGAGERVPGIGCDGGSRDGRDKPGGSGERGRDSKPELAF